MRSGNTASRERHAPLRSAPPHELAELLALTRRELDRADRKAEVILAASSVLTGGVLAMRMAGGWSPEALPPTWRIVWWSAFVGWLTGLVLVLLVVCPRSGRIGGASDHVVGYFGDVARCTDSADLGTRLATSASTSAQIDQLYQVSRIVSVKYRLLRAAIALLASAAACAAVTIIVARQL